MGGRNLYGVFFKREGKAVWGMLTSKRAALREAKKTEGYVRWMPYPEDTPYWDAGTFIVCSFILADFRADQSLPLFAD